MTSLVQYEIATSLGVALLFLIVTIVVAFGFGTLIGWWIGRR